MKYIKQFEGFREEYPGMFGPVKPEDIPQTVPGFEGGTIDPEDDEVYTDPYGNIKFSDKSDKERYEDFKTITRERNIYETPDEIIINLKKLYHDFIMSIYNPNKHYMEFVNDELIGKYVCDVKDFMKDENIEGVVQKIEYNFNDNFSILSFKLKNSDSNINDNVASDIITIDKLKSSSSKYNL